MSLEQNFITLCQTIRAAENKRKSLVRFKGSKASVRLLAVSKTKPASMIRELFGLGQRNFGENYVAEAVSKMQQLNDLKTIQWHMIGHLQSNKTKITAESFDWVHTIDRSKVAFRLNAHRPTALPPLNVCVQINISCDSSKSGMLIDQVNHLAQEIVKMPNLKLRGLMAIPAKANVNINAERLRLKNEFKMMYEQYRSLQQYFPTEVIDTLSMGMSSDMSLAIEEGSTLIRVGTALFGQR